MAAEIDVADANRPEDRGMNRRQMIKAAGIAGAAAWTAPMIIDSITSPAAAVSYACKPYFVKLYPNGSVSHNCPGSGTGLVVTAGTPLPTTESFVSFNITDSGWAGGPSTPGCAFSLAASAKGASVASDGTFWKVTLTNCVFATGTDWQIGGRYDISLSTERYMQVVDGPTSNSNDGYFTADGATAWIPQTYPLNVGTKQNPHYPTLDYIYVKMCCK